MRAVSDRCDRCDGVMLATMPKPNMPDEHDDAYELVCMLCGHNNRPTPNIDEIRKREKAERKPKGMMMGDNGQDVPRKQGRCPKEKVHPSHIPQIIKDGTYDRFTEALEHRCGTFLAHDIATELGMTSGVAGACLRRARGEGLVQDIGKRCMAAPHKGLVALWEAVPERAQRAS